MEWGELVLWASGFCVGVMVGGLTAITLVA